MSRDANGQVVATSERVYRWLLRAYPHDFRRDYGVEMIQLFRNCVRDAFVSHGGWGVLRLWFPTLGDAVVTAWRVWTEEASTMTTLSARELQRHIKVLGWLYLLGSVVFLLIGGGVYVSTVLSQSAGAVSSAVEPIAVLGLLTLLALPAMIAGEGLLKRQERGRAFALIVAFFTLATFPIGTAVGLYTYWVLLQASTADTFAHT